MRSVGSLAGACKIALIGIWDLKGTEAINPHIGYGYNGHGNDQLGVSAEPDGGLAAQHAGPADPDGHFRGGAVLLERSDQTVHLRQRPSAHDVAERTAAARAQHRQRRGARPGLCV